MRGGVAAAATLVLVGAMSAQAASPNLARGTFKAGASVGGTTAASVSRTTIQRVGTTTVSALRTGQASGHAPVALPLLLPHPRSGAAHTVPTAPAASFAGGRASLGQPPGTLLQSFDGINAIQNESTAFPLEPPDEGLGAGNGFVANFVNVTGGIYSTDGQLLAGPFFLNDFFGESASANTSDPRVYYDASTHTWIATILEYDITGQGTIGGSRVDVAASQSSDPTGAWNLYQIDTTNLNHGGCPCLADYPILGVDSQNVYISTNEFNTTESAFNGAQLYALSKSQLVAGQSTVNTVVFQNLSIDGAPAFHVQPANEYGSSNAEWLMSSLDPNGTSNNQIGVWAVTNESSVTSGQGTPTLSSRVINSQLYAFPPDAKNPKGTCSACNSGAGAPTTGLVQTDWDAMQETQYINGQLVGALNTGVNIAGDTHTRTGAAWFVVHPSLNGAAVGANTHVVHQGILAVQGEYMLYPHINMTGNGAMAVTFTLGGKTTYLSAGYSVARAGRSFKLVKLAAAGTGPDNGFTGTTQYGGANRWGDYSNGEIIPGTNKLWLATQYIPNNGGAYTNWGNRIFELRLP